MLIELSLEDWIDALLQFLLGEFGKVIGLFDCSSVARIVASRMWEFLGIR